MSLNSIRPIPPGIKRGKQQLVVAALTRLARKLGPGEKLPTARELAKALSITGATLTRCLERLEGQGVLRCRQGSGIYVDVGVLQKRVGLVFGENIFSPEASQFGALMLKYCAQRAADRNERFSFFIDNPASNGVMNGCEVPSHQDLVDALKDDKLDGIILMARATAEQESWLRSQGVPVVGAECRIGALEPGAYSVVFDYEKLIYLGLEGLMRVGCKTVGLLGILNEHREMFQKVLKKFNLPCKDEWMVCSSIIDSLPSQTHEQFGRECASRLLTDCGWNAKSKKRSSLPDGVLITDDMMAHGVLPLLSERGIAIGKDLTICSHSNKGSVMLKEWEKIILRVQFDPEDMAVGLLNMLESLMNGKPIPSLYYISPVLEA